MTLRGHRLGSTATALGAVAVAALSLTPVIYLFASGISLSDIRSEFHYPSTVSALLQTVGLTASVSVLTVAIGVGCALLVARTTVVLPRLLTVLFALPLAVPGFVSSYAAYSAQLLYVPRLDLVTSFTGASLVLALTLYPYVFLPCVVALRTIDPALEEVAASLRPQRLTRLRHVVLPALRPAIAAGVLIVALHVIAEYGAMVQLGQTTLTTKVMAEMLNYGDYQTARSLSLLLAGVSMLVLAITWIVATTGTAKQVAHGSNRPATFTSLGRWRLPIALVSLVVPIAALGPTVFMTTRGLTDPNRSVVVDWSTVGSALWSTTGYAVAAALVATLLAFPVSWWVTRRATRSSMITERLVWLAHAIPSAILALALVYLATHLVPSFYKTPSVLVIAYVILFLPLAVAYQRVGLGRRRRVTGHRPAPPVRAHLTTARPARVRGRGDPGRARCLEGADDHVDAPAVQRPHPVVPTLGDHERRVAGLHRGGAVRADARAARGGTGVLPGAARAAPRRAAAALRATRTKAAEPRLAHVRRYGDGPC